MTVTLGSFKHTDLGLFRCRVCGHSGKLDTMIRSNNLDWKSIAREQKKAAELAEKEEAQRQFDLQTWLNESRAYWHLHKRLLEKPQIIEKYLEPDGIGINEVKRWFIGYSPTFMYRKNGQMVRGPAISFPITNRNGRILNIRMKLLNEKNGNKYRPIRAGLGIQYFDASYYSDDRLFIVEGEKKAIVLHKYGISTWGLYGVEVWKPEWGKIAKKRFKAIYVLFDNQANEGVLRASETVCADTGGKPLWVPGKPDDFLLKVDNLNKFFESMKGVPNG